MNWSKFQKYHEYIIYIKYIKLSRKFSIARMGENNNKRNEDKGINNNVNQSCWKRH